MIPIGSLVRVVAPGSRETNGESQVIPAIVIGAWPNGQLDLYAFHFQGSPLLMHADISTVEILFIGRALNPPPQKPPEQPRFTLVDDAA